MKLKIDEATWRALHAQLFARTDVETAGILVGDPLTTTTGPVVAIRNAFAVPEAAYRIRRRDQLSIDPVAFNRLTRPARDKGQSVFTIHTHPGADSPWFSYADDAGDSRLMPSLHCRIPEAPHGSLVAVDNGSAIARTWRDGEFDPVRVQIVGRVITEQATAELEPAGWFARQELALGAAGQRRLRRLRVGVIGLGGTGSVAAMQLAHLGAGDLVLVDGDQVEASNVSRIVGATRADVGATFKVDVAERYVSQLGLGTRVEAHKAMLDASLLEVLGGCDVLLSCVDRQTPRALLNRWAYSHLIPTIDLGTAFRVDGTGRVTGDAGRVVVVGPGRPCLACWGHIDPDALRIEALSPEEIEEQEQAGYIEGANVAQPSVIAFNTMVAGAAVIELLRLVTGFAGADTPPSRLAFSFTEGTVRRNTLASDNSCSICGHRPAGRVAA